MEKDKDKDKDDAPKSVADYWISLGMKQRKPGDPSGFVIGTGGPVEKKDDQPK